MDAINECREKKEEAIVAEEFKKAIKLKEEENNLYLQLGILENKKKNNNKKQKLKPQVTEKDVAKVLAQRLNTKPERFLLDEWDSNLDDVNIKLTDSKINTLAKESLVIEVRHRTSD